LSESVDTVIIGAGPAGCAAAVQCTRLGLSIALLDETGEPGGLIRNAFRVENFPCSEPVSGQVLACRFAKQLESFGIAVRKRLVNSVRRTKKGFLTEGIFPPIESSTIIAATGTASLYAGIDGERTARGVFYCPVDILDPFPASIAIIGGGEAAWDYSLTCAERGADTVLIVRSGFPVVAGRLLDMVEGNDHVRILYDTVVENISGRNGRLVLQTIHPDGSGETSFGAVLIAVGRKSRIPQMMNGFHIESVYADSGVEGVFTAGDVCLGVLGQACSAAGQGLTAAGRAFEFIRRRGQG
jgi:thioredoxin reductase (NADPH)